MPASCGQAGIFSVPAPGMPRLAALTEPDTLAGRFGVDFGVGFGFGVADGDGDALGAGRDGVTDTDGLGAAAVGRDGDALHAARSVSTIIDIGVAA
jgi:hypothetical protein